MSGHKWSAAQRAKFIRTMRGRSKSAATERVNPNSHFFRIKNGKPYPVRVKRITLLVLS